MAENKEDKEKKELAKNTENKTENTESIISEEILQALPVEERGKILSIVQQSMFSGVVRRGNPISEKITSEHISTLIDKSDKQDIRDREERKSQRNHSTLILVIGLVFLGFLIVFLKDDKELLYKIIIAIISFVGGFGIGQRQASKKEN